MNQATLTREAYEHWAPLYPPVAHNPLMRAEERAMRDAWPTLEGRRVLDLACGSGRYAQLANESNAAQVIAVDFCLPMLVQVASAERVCASMMQLPFRSAAFDFVVSGLAVGHATDLGQWMSEVSRVLNSDGTVLYSDFHSAAIQAGMTRSFKDAHGASWTVPHQVYELSAQQDAMAAVGLELDSVMELRMGMELNEPFPGSEQAYRQWYGVPVVLIVRATKR
jgi:malonyl-CoA O-methyltransferase